MAEDRDAPLLLPDHTGDEEHLDVPSILPVLPVRDAVVFPGVTAPLAVGRAASLAALEEAGEGGFLLIATQRDPADELPGPEDLHPVACIARVVKVMGARGESGKHAVVVGVVRARVGALVAESSDSPTLRVEIEPLVDRDEAGPERDGAWQRVISLAQTVIDLRDDMPEEWKGFIGNLPSPGLLADLVASTLPISVDEKIALLAEPDVTARLERTASHLEREVTIAETQRTLSAESEEEDPKRRERLLRRRMREIQAELGEVDSASGEVDELRERIESMELPDDVADQAERELKRLAALPPHAPDRHLLRGYLEWIADLPWTTATEDKLELSEARRVLDEDHHGLDKVKERILEFLAVRKLAPEAPSPILCFVGPPGVGKTSLGRSIARAMGRKFARAALGGVRDEAEIRGHRRTYVGAMPGRILQSLRRAGSRNPIFLLDEVDKLGADFRGDPSSALLEVLDPEQNHAFSDHYLEVPFDLSKVLFIATANTLSTVPAALLDRMEVIELPGYTDRDKLAIARSHLVPKQLDEHGLAPERVRIEDGALRVLVDEYTREAGVRSLDRQLATLARKAAMRIAGGAPDDPLVVDEKFVREALGAPPHLPETAERTKIPGVVVGLAATSHGGDILFIEATALPGGEALRLRLTGQLGDVMRESAETAVSWVRANAASLGCEHPVLSGGELHLHVPAGAVPKDGPSAGITLATAVVSVLSGRRARGDLAMTGEISLRGRVLPVGGIKDKILAAQRAGIQTVVIPRRNEKDLVEVPKDVRESLEIVPVETVQEALEAALLPWTPTEREPDAVSYGPHVRVALVHDWLTGMRGGERVLHELCSLFPDADLHTLVHVPGTTSQRIEDRRIFASPLSHLPGAARHYRKLLPLFPWAVGRLDLSGYDVVVSSSHAFAKGVFVPPGTPHLCYCFTPMRYVWDQIDAYVGRGWRRRAAMPLVGALRRWDRRTSTPERITRVVAISETVQRRVRRHWDRDADVIFPPVDVERIRPDGDPPDDFFLMVGAFVPYKREALAIEAFRRLDARLVVAGDGPLRERLAAGAPSNVEFLGRVSDAELARLYARCRALVYPQEEDFGIVAVEAQAAGRPVVAFGAGGAAETVVPLSGEAGGRAPTGVWFRRAEPDALAEAVRAFLREEKAFDAGTIRAHAERFSAARFRREMGEAVASLPMRGAAA